MITLLRAIGNMISGFAGAMLLGADIYGFALGAGICLLFNIVVSILTNKEFAATVLWLILSALKYIGALLLVVLAFQIPTVLIIGIMWLSETPWGKVVFVSAIFVAIIVLIKWLSKSAR